MKKAHIKRNMFGAIAFLLLLTTTALTAQEKMFITTESNDARTYFIDGRELMERFHLDDASKKLENAINQDQNFAQAYLYLAFTKGGLSGISQPYLIKAIEYAGTASPGEKHLIYLVKASKNKDSDEADRHISALLELNPRDERIRTWVAWYYQNIKAYDKAKYHLRKAVTLNKEYHPAWNMLGYTHMEMGNMSMAEKAFNKYIELIPEEANPYDSYAECMLRQGRFDESIKNYSKALTIDPNFISSYLGRGDSYLFFGDFDKAKENYQTYYNKTNDIQGKLNALLLETSLEMQRNNISKAVEVMDRYIELAEEQDMPFQKIYGTVYKGYIYAENDNTQKGLTYFQKVSDMIPNEKFDEKSRKRLQSQAQLWNMYGMAANNDIEDAEKICSKCEAEIAKSGLVDLWDMYHSMMGFLEIRKGNYNTAIEHLEEAIENPVTWYYTGLAWEK